MEIREEGAGISSWNVGYGVSLYLEVFRGAELTGTSGALIYVYTGKEVWLLLTVEFSGYLHAALHVPAEIDLAAWSYKTSLYREHFILGEINAGSLCFALVYRTFRNDRG